MPSEIDEILSTYANHTLWEMALAAGLPWARGAKPNNATLVANMRTDYFTEARIRASAAKLSPQERGVLDLALQNDEPVATAALARRAIALGLAQPAPEVKRGGFYRADIPYATGYVGTPSNPKSLVFEDIIARLTLRGLLFSRFEMALGLKPPYKLQLHPALLLYTPAEVRRCVFAATARPVWRPRLVTHANPQMLLRSLYLYWDFVRRNDITLTQTGLVPKRSLKAINKTLFAPDPTVDEARTEQEMGLLRLLRMLLTSLGLLYTDNQYLHLRAAAAGPGGAHPFWALSEPEQLHACLSYWMPSQEKAALPISYGPHYNHARRALALELRRLKAGEWVEIERFIETLYAHDANFFFADHSKALMTRGEWFSSSSGLEGSTQQVIAQMEELERGFVMQEVGDALFGLGILDLGLDAEAAPPVGLRLTPLGAALLADAPLEAAPPAPNQDVGRVVVQPNYQIMALGPVSLATLARLDRFADRERADASVFEYRLSREAIYRAQQAGLTLAEITRALEEVAHHDIPQNVRRSLAEWGANYERIVFRTGVSLLQAASPQLLQRLLASPAVRGHLGGAVNDRVALVAPRADAALVDALLAQGLLPCISGTTAEDHSVEISDEGVIRPLHAAPSLNVLGRLARLAEPIEDGAWRLTPETAIRAGVGRGPTQRLLDELATLSRGALPEPLVNQVKAWGHFYGAAAIETLTLIAFDDRATLDELRARPDLSDYLTPFPSEQRALAVVRAEHLPQVRETLARLGVPVRGRLAS